MKRLLWLSAAAVGVIAALFFLRPKQMDVAFRDLTWNERDGVVIFDFKVANLTDENITVMVDLVAEQRLPSDTEPEITTIGSKRVESRLSPRQEKTEHGQMNLTTTTPRGRLTVSPFFTVKKIDLPAAPKPAANPI